MNPLHIEEVLDRGEQVIAIIEGGYGLYFGEAIGMELVLLIAARDAQRDVAALPPAVRGLLDYT